MGIGSGIGAIGSIFGGMAQSQSADYQAQVAANNAITSTQNATYSEQAGAAATEDRGYRNAARQGAVKSGLAANGVDVNTGSAVDVQASQREIGDVDTARTMTNAELQAYGYRTAATNFQAQEGLDEMQSSNAMMSGLIGGLGSLAGGASQGGGGGIASMFSGLGGLSSIGSTG